MVLLVDARLGTWVFLVLVYLLGRPVHAEVEELYHGGTHDHHLVRGGFDEFIFDVKEAAGAWSCRQMRVELEITQQVDGAAPELRVAPPGASPSPYGGYVMLDRNVNDTHRQLIIGPGNDVWKPGVWGISLSCPADLCVSAVARVEYSLTVWLDPLPNVTTAANLTYSLSAAAPSSAFDSVDMCVPYPCAFFHITQVNTTTEGAALPVIMYTHARSSLVRMEDVRRAMAHEYRLDQDHVFLDTSLYMTYTFQPGMLQITVLCDDGVGCSSASGTLRILAEENDATCSDAGGFIFAPPEPEPSLSVEAQVGIGLGVAAVLACCVLAVKRSSKQHDDIPLSSLPYTIDLKAVDSSAAAVAPKRPEMAASPVPGTRSELDVDRSALTPPADEANGMIDGHGAGVGIASVPVALQSLHATADVVPAADTIAEPAAGAGDAGAEPEADAGDAGAGDAATQAEQVVGQDVDIAVEPEPASSMPKAGNSVDLVTSALAPGSNDGGDVVDDAASPAVFSDARQIDQDQVSRAVDDQAPAQAE